LAEPQVTPSSAVVAIGARTQEDAVVGDVLTSTFPLWSDATQSFADGQLTPVRRLSSLTTSSFQAEAPPVGLVEVSISLDGPTIRHSFVEGQATALALLKPARVTTFQADAPPVGFFDEATVPETPAATQSEVPLHATAERVSVWSAAAATQVAGFVGVTEVMTSPM
jgi:hypothetical protein